MTPDGTTVQSSPLTFTIGRAPATLTCELQNLAHVYSRGQALHVAMSFSTGNVPVDWENGTFTLKFVGPTTVTDANLTADSNDVVTAPAPSQTGNYQLQCNFSGTSQIAPTGFTRSVTVSLERQIASVQVFTNPTALTSQQPADMYFVFHPAPGTPIPTGQFFVNMAYASSWPIDIGSDGTVLVHVINLPGLIGVASFSIYYTGDPNYNSATFTFPLTNPPIPAGSGSSGTTSGSISGGGTTVHAQVTATPAKTATATATATGSEAMAAATPTGVAPASALAVQEATSSGNPLVWLVIALILLVVGGGAGGIFFWRRRAKSSVDAGQVSSPDFTPNQWPPLDD